MDSNKKSFLQKETKIGIVVACAIAMLYFGINFLKGINIFTPSTVFYVQYDRIDGIVKTTPVYVNGFKVGHVSDIQFDYTKEAPIILELTVDEELVVTDGTVAEVYETGLLGEKAIELHLKAGSQALNYGDTLQSSVKQGMLASTIEELVPPIKAMMPTVDSTIQSIRTIIESEEVKNIISNADSTVNSLKEASDKINFVMDNDVPVIMADAKRITGNVDKITADISAVDLKKTFNDAKLTIDNLKLVTDKFNQTDNTIGMLLNDKQLYQHIDSIAFNANALIVDLKANPKRYVHFSLFGAKEKKDKSKENTKK